MKRDDFVAELDAAKAVSVPRWRSNTKRVAMWLYCRGLLPASAVTWIFDRLRLRDA